MLKTSALSLGLLSSTLLLTSCQGTLLSGQDSKDTAVVMPDTTAVATLKHTDLSYYHWQLISVKDGSGHPVTVLDDIKQQVALDFGQSPSDSWVSFGVGCNRMGGSYSLNSNVLVVTTVASTEMMCEPKINDAERLLAQLMQGSSQLSYKKDAAPLLTQTTANGHSLVWQGAQTAEARYKQHPDIVFWRVDHHKPPCPDGSTKTCLKVRPVIYDDKGIKTGEGPWSLFVGDIEGYTHDSTVNTVLRLKRFVVDPVDVKGKQFVYVLDAVVESAIADTPYGIADTP